MIGYSSDSQIIERISKTKYDTIDYLSDIRSHLYQTTNWQPIQEQIKSIPLPKGVCGKIFTDNDVAWLCRTCGKDRNCVQCQECFDDSDHKGHPIYLLRNLGGCCDCGDHEDWDEAGTCTAHKGFIDESKASIDLLPSEIQRAAPLVIEELTKRLYNLFYSAKIINKQNMFNKEILELVKTFAEFNEVSPIFLYVIARAFAKLREEYTTLTEELELVVVKLEKPTSLLDIIFNVQNLLNPITCEHLNNLLISLLKSKDFKYVLGVIFVTHYVEASKTAVRKDGIAYLSAQFAGTKEFSKIIFSSNEYCTNFIKAIKSALDEIITNEAVRGWIIMSFIRTDLKLMFHPDVMEQLKDKSFLFDFIEVCSEFSFAKKLRMLETHIEYERNTDLKYTETENFLLSIFRRLCSSIDYTDIEYCKRIAHTFKELIRKLYMSAKEIEESYYTIPVHRFLAYFLINYMHVQLTLKHLKANGPIIRSLFKELFDIKGDKEFMEFVLEALYPILKVIGFYLEACSKKWINHGTFISNQIALYDKYTITGDLADFALCSLLISSLDSLDVKVLGEFFIHSLSQGDNWFKTIMTHITSFDLSIPLTKSFEEAKIDSAKGISLLENILFTLGGMCSQDCISLPIFLYFAKGKYSIKNYMQEINEDTKCINKYAYHKYLVHAYLSNKEVWVNYKKIVSEIPSRLKPKEEIDNELRTVSEIDTAQGKCKLKEEYTKLYDPFFFIFQSRLSESEDRTRELYKKINDPLLINPVFGIMNDNDNPFDLASSFSKVMASTDIVNWLLLIIKRANKGELTDNIVVSTLKIMRCFKKFVGEEIIKLWIPEIKEAVSRLGENMKMYHNLLEAFQREFDKSKVKESAMMEDTKEIPKKKQAKILEEFKNRSKKFAEKNEQTLSTVTISNEAIICIGCKEELSIENFAKKPYGVLIHIDTSNVYECYVRQSIPSYSYPHGLSFNSCGHFMHFSCYKELYLASSTNVMLLEKLSRGLNLIDCPLCKASFTTLYPVTEALEPIGNNEELSKYVFLFLYELMKIYDGSKLKGLTPENLLHVLSKLIFHSIKTAGLYDVFSLMSKKRIFLSVLFSIRWYYSIKKDKEVLIRFHKKLLAQINTNIEHACKQIITLIDKIPLETLIRNLLFFTLAKENNKETEVLLNKTYLLYLEETLWQITVSSVIGNDTKALMNYDIKTLREFIKSHESVIKGFYLKSLQEAAILKNMLLDTNVVDLQTKTLEELEAYLSVSEVFVNFIKLEHSKLLLPPNEILKELQKELKDKKVPVELKISTLVKPFAFTFLDEYFNDCLVTHYKRKCKNCGKQVKQNSLCLICGDIVCATRNCCIYEGMSETNYHSKICAGGKGIFFYFPENILIVMNNNIGIFHPSPYVNSRGESISVTRQTFEILKLDKAKLEEIKMIFLQEKITTLMGAQAKLIPI